MKEELFGFEPRRALIAAICVIVGTWLLSFLMPTEASEFGAWSLLPATFLIVYIFITKRILESLVLSCLMGLIMAAKTINVFGEFSVLLTDTMLDPDMAWLIIVCGLMGSIIALIERSGGAIAFGNWAAKHAKGEKSSLVWTWIMGVAIFLDDYLNSMAVGSCMRSLTDKFKVPREMLAYVVDSTAAPLCVLIPISTWAVFAGGLLEVNGWAPEGMGLIYFIQTIPYNFYAWVAAIMVILVIFRIIPVFGPMKKAYARVESGGPLAPEGSEKIDLYSGDNISIPTNPKMMNLIIPILSLIFFTIIFDIDMQMGVICTLVVMFVLYLAQGIMNAEEFADCVVKGLQNMIMPLLLMVLAWVFAAMSEQIGFTQYVIDTVAANVGVALLPFVVFVALAITQFVTGTNWGLYIIALPIVIPLAIQMDANVALSVGAVISAGVLGSHCCFYSDATVLTSAACGCDNFRHAFTQMPYGILAGVIAAIMFLVCGFIMG
jgi:Na+/H+ antiporter NhaC